MRTTWLCLVMVTAAMVGCPDDESAPAAGSDAPEEEVTLDVPSPTDAADVTAPGEDVVADPDMGPTDTSDEDATDGATGDEGAEVATGDEGPGDIQPPPPGTGLVPPCEHVGAGTDYPVGPGQTYEQLGDVPWGALAAGDTVRIHWREEPYREKLVLSTQATADQPLRVCGVTGPQGQLPVLSGDGATTPAGMDFGGWLPMQDLGLVIVFHPSWAEKPAHIVIEGLELRRAMPDYSYVNTEGDTLPYANGAAGLWIQEGDGIVVRGNTITDNGNGLFALSKPDNEASLTRDILVEANYIYGNGNVGSDHQHNLYVQAIGATYQYNRFGPIRPGALGGNLKDRSAGTVIRFNWIEGGLRPIDLVEVQEHAPWVLVEAFEGDPELLPQIEATEALYRQAFVYGNLIQMRGSTDGSSFIHYGWDTIPEYTRKGTLWCFHNTFLATSDQDDLWRVRLLDVTTLEETVQFFHNVALIRPETAGATPSNFYIMRYSGVVELGTNLISTGWLEMNETDADAVVNGATNLIDLPGGVDAALDPETLVLSATSPAIDQATAPPPAGLVLPDLHEYVPHQAGQPRPLCGAAPDLGALERCP